MPRIPVRRAVSALSLVALSLTACAVEDDRADGPDRKVATTTTRAPSSTETPISSKSPPPETAASTAPAIDLRPLSSQVVAALDEMAAGLDRARWACSPDAPTPPPGAGLADLCTTTRRTTVPVAAGWARTIVMVFDGVEATGGRVDDPQLSETGTLARAIVNALATLPACPAVPPGADCGALDGAVAEVQAQMEALIGKRPAWEAHLP